MVTVKMFGTFRLDCGIQELHLEGKRVKDLYPQIMDAVLAKDPNTTLTMKDVKGCIVCIRGKQVKPSTKISDGEEIMLVPAVAGG